MTEEEWLTGSHLHSLMHFASEKISPRMLLLFACVVAETVVHDPAAL